MAMDEVGDTDLDVDSGGDSSRRSGKQKKVSLSFRDRFQAGEEDDEEFVITRASSVQKTDRFEAGPTPEEKEARRRKKQEAARIKQLQAERQVFIPSSVTVARLAGILGLKWSRLQIRMAQLGMTEEQRRSDYMLTEEEAVNVALEFGFDPKIDDEAFFDIIPQPDTPDVIYPLRPPIVTIMGHVDHGKTTLLDSLRNTAVAAGEAGGITQHIGAFSVNLSDLQGGTVTPGQETTITFLDTPGHAAFTEMRARGATVTDIVVLVVAADDGVMPQTREVLNLVKEAGDDVGLVVAINKVDKSSVDVEKIKSGLGAEGIHLEEDGGDVPSVRVSGLTRLGLDNLVETLSTLAELRELRARNDGQAEGYVLESNKDIGKGNIATVLVTKGTLRVGSYIVAGTTFCRVRTMINDQGQNLDLAGPGTPVQVTGWRELPEAGDQLLESVNGEHEAKRAIANRIAAQEQQKMLSDIEVINVKRQEDRLRHELETEEEKAIKLAGGNLVLHRIEQARRATVLARENQIKELRLIIKGDVSGTVEAVEGALSGIGNKEAVVKIVSTGVGAVTESDLAMAEASEGLIIGFNVDCPRPVQQLAKQLNVPIHLETVIYRLIETVRAKTAALLPPAIEYRTNGEALVQQVFEITLKKKQKAYIAGCKVSQGSIKRGSLARVFRGPDRQLVFEGEIETLKHLKKDVDEIRKGTECGVGLANFKDLKEGDEIVAVTKVEVPRTL
ncbi:hypothetical protein BD324DRAFT_580627 [Kockovaella imperatae]|uniref:Translation initiation factor IF-2, mitochondrial n=1 Tax=Kockovaella imperatae TaxID=4999 RepID=A0A1Y1UGY6_9TREE|nr:hypothetical protein BD324DRAFT_580627 [Kockovaella imperatae]ORX36345.1 hypothetical protein BD324DRAFT_580627 [Kockovaella imperatae]